MFSERPSTKVYKMADVDSCISAVCGLQFITVVVACMLIQRKRKRRRKYWVKPWIQMRNVSGAYHALFNQLLTTDMQSFQNFMRMDFVAFEELLSRVEARLIKQQTRMIQSISPRERLCIAVRYLATGNLLMQFYGNQSNTALGACLTSTAAS